MAYDILKDTGSHVVRLYLWEQLKRYMPDKWKHIERELPDGTKINTIPIIPAQEQPEVQDSGRPYIVYIYDVHSTGDLYQLERESISLVVYSQDAGLISSTTKLITKLLNKYDDSARDINHWIKSPMGIQQAYGDHDWVREMRRYSFKEIHVSGSVGAQPAPGEGGRMDSIITVELVYTESHNRDGVRQEYGFGH